MSLPAGGGRYAYLDGLRGVAALAVVLCHFVLAFQPALLSGKAGQGAVAAGTGLSRTPLMLFWSPDCAVHVFFVLSGFVLSSAMAVQPAGRPIARLGALLLRRWVRLAGPILGSSLLAWGVIEAGWLRNGPAAALNGSDWLAAPFGWLAWQPNSLPALVEQSLWSIFATSMHWWNPALWTMPVEFWGSAGLFTAYTMLRLAPIWMRVAVLTAGLAGLARFNAGGFVVGALLWEGRALLAHPGRRAWWGGAGALAGGVVLGGAPYDLLGTLYWPAFVWASGWVTEPLLVAHRVGAALLVMAALSWPPLQWALTRPTLLALGRVSFMVYLCHIIVLCSLASALVLRLTPGWGYDAATGVALVAAVAAVLGVAAVMTRLVDAPSTRLSRRAERAALALPGRTWAGRGSRGLPAPDGKPALPVEQRSQSPARASEVTGADAATPQPGWR